MVFINESITLLFKVSDVIKPLTLSICVWANDSFNRVFLPFSTVSYQQDGAGEMDQSDLSRAWGGIRGSAHVWLGLLPVRHLRHAVHHDPETQCLERRPPKQWVHRGTVHPKIIYSPPCHSKLALTLQDAVCQV